MAAPPEGLTRRGRTSRLRAKRVYAISQQQHEAAAARRRRQAAKIRRLRVIGAALMALGLAVGVGHVLEHLLALWLFAPGWQDLLIGYPTAGALILIGSFSSADDPGFPESNDAGASGRPFRPSRQRQRSTHAPQHQDGHPRRSASRQPALTGCTGPISPGSPDGSPPRP